MEWLLHNSWRLKTRKVNYGNHTQRTWALG
jgi:hypothetical protein